MSAATTSASNSAHFIILVSLVPTVGSIVILSFGFIIKRMFAKFDQANADRQVMAEKAMLTRQETLDRHDQANAAQAAEAIRMVGELTRTVSENNVAQTKLWAEAVERLARLEGHWGTIAAGGT